MPETTYTVKPGDTLSKIATDYGVNMSDITGYASGDPNKIGVGETLKVATRATTPANVVDAPNLGQPQYKTPTPTPQTGYAGLIASANAAITELTPTVEKDAATIKSKYDRLGQLPSDRATGYEEEGVYTKQGEYRRQVNTINQKELAYQTRIDKIRNENPTGQLTEGQQIQIDKLSKDWAIEKAGLSISAAFAKDDYELAKSIVDTRVDAETEGLKNELAGLQYFYSENKDTLTDERKNLLEFQISQIEDEKAKVEQLYTEIGSIQLAAAENGAPASVVAAIGRATDLTSAISNAGSWIDQTIDRTGKGGAGTVDLAPEDERALTGAGFSTQDIADLRKSVAEFGIKSVLDTIQKERGLAAANAVRKVYGQSEVESIKRSDIESVTQDVATKWLEDNFNEEELKRIAREKGFASWWKTQSAEKSAFLKSEDARKYYIEAMVKKATDAGWIVE